MNLDDRIADLRAAIEAETALARGQAIAEFLELVERVRGGTEAERTAALEEAGRRFEPSVLAFLKTLTPPGRVSHEEKDLRAQRFARVQVAQIQLYHGAQVKAGRAAGNVYEAVQSQMDAARDAYREKFLTPVNGTAYYLHGEFVRTLANDDAALLGPGYPGPLA